MRELTGQILTPSQPQSKSPSQNHNTKSTCAKSKDTRKRILHPVILGQELTLVLLQKITEVENGALAADNGFDAIGQIADIL